MVVGVLREMYIRQPGLGRPLLVPIIPSLRSYENEALAAQHRFACDMPTPTDAMPFLRYAIEFIRTRLTPIDRIPEFEEWLDATNYPGSRKDYFRRLQKDLVVADKSFFRVDAFIKLEGYDEPKNPRAICSPSDESKVYLGPMCHAIDKATFSSVPYFVKGTDPKEWPRRLQELFGANPVTGTDFSSFEAHQRGIFADIICYWFRHMTRKVPGACTRVKVIKQLVKGRRTIKFPCSIAQVDERLMSGAMWTSSSNGLLNLLIMSYLSLHARHPDLDGAELLTKLDDFVGLVEGDDGICRRFDPLPGDIERLGCRLKMSASESFDKAGFCKIICDPESLDTIRDPIKVLSHFFVLDPKLEKSRPAKIHAMLRAKALSFKYVAGNCPIIGVLADEVLTRTRSVDVSASLQYLESHKRDLVTRAVHAKIWQEPARISQSSRVLVESVFGVTVAEQLRIESEIRGGLVVDLEAYALDHHYVHSAVFIQPIGTEHHLPERWYRRPPLPVAKKADVCSPPPPPAFQIHSV